MTEEELHSLSDKYDSVYLHPVRTSCNKIKGRDKRTSFASPCVDVSQESFTVGVAAVGSVLQLVDQVMTSELRNGFAVVR